MTLPSGRPGSSVLRLVLKPHERRRTPRLVVVDWLYDLRGEILPTQDRVVLRDLSLGGFAIESSAPIPRDVRHQFRFIAEDGEAFVITAASRHSSPIEDTDGQRYITGFEFMRDTTDGAADPVAQLIRKIHLALS